MTKISVLLPYYNDQKFIGESIKSILNQTFEDFELILINHASTDNSKKIAYSFNDKRIKHIVIDVNQGAGGGHIMKAFLNYASGKYFKSMCADDIMMPNCLEILYKYLENNQDCELVFGDMEFIDIKNKSLNEFWFKSKEFDIENDSLLKKYFNGVSVLPYPGAMAKMDKMKKLLIDYTIYGMFDMYLWVQFLVNDWKIQFVENVVCKYRLHKDQESSGEKFSKVLRIGNYESPTFYKHFLKLPIDKVKSLLPDNFFARIACEGDQDFILTNYWSYSDCDGLRFFSLNYLQNLMQNDERRLYIGSKFGYQIKDLRFNYANLAFGKNVIKTNYEELKISLILKILRKRIKKNIFNIFRKKKNFVV